MRCCGFKHPRIIPGKVSKISPSYVYRGSETVGSRLSDVIQEGCTRLMSPVTTDSSRWTSVTWGLKTRNI